MNTIQKDKIQPPGVMGWTDVHNNEAYMAGKLVCTNNGASLYYAMGARKHPLFEKTQVILTPGGPAGSFNFAGGYNWGVFQKSKYHELSEDMIRWVEDEKRFEEYMKACSGQAGPSTSRAPTTRTGIRTRTSRACGRTSCAACRPDIPGPSRRRPSRCRRVHPL